MKKIVVTVLAVALAVGLTGCAKPFDTFKSAYASCVRPSGVEISDGGNTITVDMKGDTDWSGARIEDVFCVVDAVGTPEYIQQHMWDTNSLDGRQTDEFDGIEVTWTYHPDDGINIIYHKTDD